MKPHAGRITAGLVLLGALLALIWNYALRPAGQPSGVTPQSRERVKGDDAVNPGDPAVSLSEGKGKETRESPHQSEPTHAGEPEEGRRAEQGKSPGRLEPPRTEQVRREIENDPHRTPPSLLRFAERMGEKMDIARVEAVFARDFMGELENCVQSSEGALSAKALCLRNAERLAGSHPQLNPILERMRSRAPEEVRDLVMRLHDLAS